MSHFSNTRRAFAIRVARMKLSSILVLSVSACAPAASTSTSSPEDARAKEPNANDDAIAVTGGTFRMGSPDTESGHDQDEGPTLTLTIAPFRIDRSPVSTGAFEAHMSEVLARDSLSKWYAETDTPASWLGKCNVGSQRGDHPVNCVNWNAARAYCQVRGGDLPTEAEWEYAARAGTTTSYWWGTAYEAGHSVDSASCKTRGCQGSTAPIASAGPRCNAWGICDIIGNIWQWTLTDYREHLDDAVSIIAPQTPKKPVHRGGAWLDNVTTLFRSAQRGLNYPEHGLTGVGFRCVHR